MLDDQSQYHQERESVIECLRWWHPLVPAAAPCILDVHNPNEEQIKRFPVTPRASHAHTPTHTHTHTHTPTHPHTHTHTHRHTLMDMHTELKAVATRQPK